MTNWKCSHCKHDNDKNTKNCKRCNSYHSWKGDKHDDDKHKKPKKRKRVYTSGVIANTDLGGDPAAQSLYVAVTNFSEHPITAKVEVFNWGDPNISAGLPPTAIPGLPMPMGETRVMVAPGERLKVPDCKTQHFHADLVACVAPALSFEVRVTIITKDDDAKFVFNAVTYSNADADADADAELPVEDILDPADPGDPEPAGGAPRTEALVMFKDFVLMDDSKDDKNCCI
ncbi:hypothetical protein [Domibacillus epiphyticus]|uniref:RanBP2-type domain-containing protein n=1 Tax=Domibacillus epiphyticus TaxID=1714355 RepID=A0A1V2A6X2_9BACI|nr:hypothetical protein [Domibacillus epiphyticus]OMP66687.1 hypothetical protein BTO28_11650 [Domibacillus epiphyticus]